MLIVEMEILQQCVVFDSDGALCAYQDYGEYGVVKQKKKEESTTPLPKSRLHL